MQLAEIDEANPVAGELEDLEANLGKARHAARLIAATRGAEQALYGADGSVVEQLATIAARLLDGVRVDSALEDHRRRVEGARLELVEVARDLERYGSRSQLDPRRAGELEERLHLLKRLSRRHGGDLSGLLAWRVEARKELDLLSQGEARVEQLSAEARRARGILGERARALSVRRAGVAARLSAGITGELRGLGMENARLDVVLEAPTTGIDVDGLRVGPKGADAASFRIAPNPGEIARPLAQIASGGELSRTLLALKRVLVGLGDVGLYVFDEVDTGVGGGIAEVIGQRLAEVGAHHQALCITHSPQVAAYGDRHFHVSKAIRDGRTFSQIHSLEGADRQVELARMVGGLELTAATHAAAGDLLRGARRARRGAEVSLRAAG
jgi:DNA repair protein RecN (Recombination protein N)